MISILVTSLDEDYFNELYPQILDTGVADALQVVVCSPYQPSGTSRIWAPDPKPEGSSKAMRKAFLASAGDIVVGMADDVTLDPKWLARSLPLLTGDNQIVALGFGTNMTCFDLPMVNFFLCRRKTVTDHWAHFYPYTSGWGDVGFGLSVWESGGKVIPSPDKPVHFRARDRRHSESFHKTNREIMLGDTLRFLNDHQETASRWMVKWARLWCYDTNLPRPNEIYV